MRLEEPDKSKWYRIFEREREKTGPLTIPNGTRVKFSRIIVRAGYYYGPMDMPKQQMLDEAMERLAGYTGLERKVVEKVVMALEEGCTYNYGPKEPFQTTKEYMALKRVYYYIRGRWMNHNVQLPAEHTHPKDRGRIRTFWYLDLEKEALGTVVGRKMRQVGRYWPPDYADCDPGGLCVWVYQQLYQVLPDYRGYWIWPNALDVFERYLVHPLDAEEVKSNG